jgi:hypothetical protein
MDYVGLHRGKNGAITQIQVVTNLTDSNLGSRPKLVCNEVIQQGDFIMKKILALSAALVTGTVLMFAAAPAMARVDVDLNVGVPGPVYVAPQPVYVQPRPVYVQPRSVYYDDGYRRHHRHGHYRHYRHDRDHDGVPNRYDRRPNNPYRY